MHYPSLLALFVSAVMADDYALDIANPQIDGADVTTKINVKDGTVADGAQITKRIFFEIDLVADWTNTDVWHGVLCEPIANSKSACYGFHRTYSDKIKHRGMRAVMATADITVDAN